jgi:LacI family transcriptional regulator
VRKPRTTLAEVARAAGVSVATVSKVVNDRADVSEATRTHVRRMLRESAYRPPQRDGRRRENLQGLIEVVFYNWQNAYTVTVLEGVSAAAQAEGFQVVVSQQSQDHQADLNSHTLRRSGRVGAIFINFDAGLDPVRSLVEDGFPVVIVDPLRVAATKCVSIGVTNFAGGVAATEHPCPSVTAASLMPEDRAP